MNSCPKISIITPTFNQGAYIEQTIQSVLGQNYERLEYIIIDGGSTDDTIDIIKKYEPHLTYWESKKDKGQSHALNKGLQQASGDILGWLNSDDLLMPGTLQYISQNLNTKVEEILCGNCIHFKENSAHTWGSDIKKAFKTRNLKAGNFIIQPSTFFTRKAWEKNGGFNETLHYTMDWDYWLKASKSDIRFKTTDRYLSLYRFHKAHKSTGTGDAERDKELNKVLSQHLDDKEYEIYSTFFNKKKELNFLKKLFNRINLDNFEPFFIKLAFFTFSKVSTKDIKEYLK